MATQPAELLTFLKIINDSMIDYSKQLIKADNNIKEAFRMLNNVPQNLTLFVTNGNGKMVGTLTDGDIRRGFLKGLELSDAVSTFMSVNFHFLNHTEVGPDRIKEIKDKGVKLLPVLDSEGCILRIIDFSKVKTLLPVDAVLMAGGRGERLRPLTDNTPKPLLKVGNKPIIEHNIDHLCEYGIRNYHITLRYLAQQIEDYFGDGSKKNIDIKYIRENQPLGTLGAVKLIQELKHDNVLVMNSDLFTNIDLEDFYQDFVKQDAAMSIASVPYVVDIPYAVLSLDNDQVNGFKEKPTYTYYSNAGIYLIKKEMLESIPAETAYHATDLIQDLIDKGEKVIRFPILGYWIDIGKPEDYQKVQEIAKHLQSNNL